ncbi:hypothetical protein QFZ86_000765 [Pseudomonas plecoglossicida]
MPFVHTGIFVPQLANIEEAFQTYLKAVEEARLAMESGCKSEQMQVLRIRQPRHGRRIMLNTFVSPC